MIWLCSLLLVDVFAIADEDISKLVSVIVLFRHGARAPTDRLSNQSYKGIFSNGLGELTDVGIEHSYDLGKFLRRRYVNTGFLRHPLLPSQVYFRSRANNRCLMSAALVASGMFSVDGKSRGAVVPIYSQEEGDTLLYSAINCTAELKRIFNMCGRKPKPSYKNFTEYEGFIFDCLGLQNSSKAFCDGQSFEMIDSLITEYNNGLPMSKWFEEHKKDIMEDHMKVENFILGAAEYHDVDTLRIKSGYLLYTVLEQLKSNWHRFTQYNALETRKFIAYSTQDWMMHAFMESLNIREHAVGVDSLPKYNSLIILELRELDDMPVVKVFFRDPTEETVRDVTLAVRNCNRSPNGCPLQVLLECCTSYITADPLKECYSGKT